MSIPTMPLLLATVASLQQPPAGAAELQVPELELTKYVLPGNGLEVILYEDHALPIVAVNVWYHAGPINEPPGRTGFAHLFEHLMFQGSANVGDDQHLKLLESAGASQINGTTSYDRTNYFETVPSNQLELALWLEADRMGFLLDTLTLEKLQNQREVVKNERRQSLENRPYGPSRERFIQTLFPPGHPYYGAVIGSMEDLEAASLDDVRAFFHQYYAPANATVVIAGDFDPQQARAWVDRYFGTLPRRPAPTTQEVTTPPITEQRRTEVVEPVMLPQVQIGWLSPPLYAPGDADADVLAYILGAGKASRMHQKLVYELELAQSVRVYQQSNALASVFAIGVIGRPGVALERLEAEVWKLVEQVRTQPPTATEVERARNMLLTQSLESLQDIGARADRINTYNQYVGDPSYLREDLGRYEQVTPESLHAFANRYLDADKAAVVWTVPKGSGEEQGAAP